MALMKVSFDEGLKKLSVEERERWNSSQCKDCAGFDSFLYDDDPVFPAYYSCKYHNTTGCEFVSRASVYCSFYKEK